uniref:Chemosensory protein 4 n=1 Tax=Dastarcus helophoroides TaxID=1169899 RepID=A0A1I9HZR1_9CUCU|nr:chemosensory protein 4 [Dastarcus helophoroides]
MKFDIPLILIVTVASVKCVPVEYYATKYDHLDIERILNNRRMVNYYASCLLNKGPCPPQGTEFKRILPEALETNCARCTEKQKFVTYHTIKRLKKEYPKIWVQLEAQWDPNHTFIPLFEASFIASSTSPSTTSTTVVPDLGNRFGENKNETETFPYPAEAVASGATLLPNLQQTTAFSSSIQSTHSTNTQHTTPPYLSYSTTKRYNVKQQQNTVSYGFNIVGDVIKNIGIFSVRVAETGKQLANVLISSLHI